MFVIVVIISSSMTSGIRPVPTSQAMAHHRYLFLVLLHHFLKNGDWCTRSTGWYLTDVPEAPDGI
jgi:hypothetical protein